MLFESISSIVEFQVIMLAGGMFSAFILSLLKF